MKKAAILGAGMMGSATAWPLTDNGYLVNLIGTHLDDEIIRSCKEKGFHPTLKRELPENVTPYYFSELDDGLEDAEFIVSGVNSMGVRWFGKTLAPRVRKGEKIICVTKGLEADEEGNLVILPDVLRQKLPLDVREKVSIVAIGGPCIAGELAGRRQSCVYFGSRETETAQELADIFRNDYYHVWSTNDVEGLEISVALKNAYALGVGIAAGVLTGAGGIDSAGAHMHNLAAALFARSCMEIAILLGAMGVRKEFAFGLPGIGDLYVTSQGGRSVTVGRLLGEGKTIKETIQILAGETLEAVMIIQQMGKALPVIYQKGSLNESQLPFMNLLVDIIAHENPVDLNLDRFFKDVII